MTAAIQNTPARNRAVTFGRAATVLLILISLLYIGIRLWRLTASCLWFDEIFSIHAARHSWPEMMKFVAADIIHPPGFYALLKIWIAVGGESLLWLRLFSVFFSVLTILPFILLSRELNLKPAETNLALLFVAVSRTQLQYAQEVRMYTPLLFFSVLSIWLFVRLLKNQISSRTEMLSLTAVNFLLVYIHYYGWIVIALQGLIVLVWRRKNFLPFLLSAGALVIAYLPWVYEVIVSRDPNRGVAENLGWISRPGLRDVALHFLSLHQPLQYSYDFPERSLLQQWWVLLFFGAPLVALVVKIVRARQLHDSEQWLLVLAFGPVVIAFVLSRLLPYPIWGNRHLIICTAPYFIIVTLAILRLSPYWIRTTYVLILGFWLLLAVPVFLMKRTNAVLSWCSWEPLVNQIPVEKTSAPTEVYAFDDLIAYHLWFAARNRTSSRINVTLITDVPEMNEDPAFFLPRRFDEVKLRSKSNITGNHIWIAMRARQWDEQRSPINIVKSMGYQIERVLSLRPEGELLIELRRTEH